MNPEIETQNQNKNEEISPLILQEAEDDTTYMCARLSMLFALSSLLIHFSISSFLSTNSIRPRNFRVSSFRLHSSRMSLSVSAARRQSRPQRLVISLWSGKASTLSSSSLRIDISSMSKLISSGAVLSELMKPLISVIFCGTSTANEAITTPLPMIPIASAIPQTSGLRTELSVTVTRLRRMGCLQNSSELYIAKPSVVQQQVNLGN